MPNGNDSLIVKLFTQAAGLQASDVHLQCDQPPIFRVKGDLSAVQGEATLTDTVLMAEIKKILSAEKYALYEQRNDVDASFQLPTKERFRINVYWERGRPVLAARFIPSVIPSLDDLDAPEATLDFVALNQGLVLVTGPTGAGKSTLLAAMIEHINQNRVEHIMTLEDPIEFVYDSKKSLVTQRELGLDFQTYADGLKHMLRQDPDIVLVGELRDPETIGLALTLAEPGHLVLATLHTNGAAQTVERIIDSFAAVQQQQIRLQLSLVLKGVISQLLVPKVGGGLTPAREVLVNSNAVANIIRDGRTEQLQNTIFTSTDQKMVDLDQELHWMIEQGLITVDVAKAHAHTPKNF